MGVGHWNICTCYSHDRSIQVIKGGACKQRSHHYKKRDWWLCSYKFCTDLHIGFEIMRRNMMVTHSFIKWTGMMYQAVMQPRPMARNIFGLDVTLMLFNNYIDMEAIQLIYTHYTLSHTWRIDN